MNGVVIRRATFDDASSITNVHIQSWQEAYRGLLPQDYLDQLSSSFGSRKKIWERISGESDKALFVAQTTEGIVGFAGFSAARDQEMKGSGELGAIYLLEKFKRQRIGIRLLKEGMRFLSSAGFLKAYCWVLEGNPAIKFYESTGARFQGRTKHDEIGGKKVSERCYEWNSLDSFV